MKTWTPARTTLRRKIMLTAGVYFGWWRPATSRLRARYVWSTVDNNAEMLGRWGPPDVASAGPPHITNSEIGVTDLRTGQIIRIAVEDPELP